MVGGAWGSGPQKPAPPASWLTWRAESPYWMLSVVIARTMARMDCSVLP